VQHPSLPHSALPTRPSALGPRPSARRAPHLALGPGPSAVGTPRAAPGTRPWALGRRHAARRTWHSALGPRPSAHRTQHSALSAPLARPALRTRPSALGPRPSALPTRPSALGPRHAARRTRHSALSPQPSAHRTQHSALSAPLARPALRTRPRLRPSTSAVAQSHGQTDGSMSTPARLQRATEDAATELEMSGAHAQFRRADDSAHIRSTCSLASEREPEGCAEHSDPGSREPRAARDSFEPLTRTSPPLRTLESVGGPMPVPPPYIPVLDSSVGSQCSPRRRTDFGDRRRARQREIDRGRTLPARPNFGGEYPAPLLTAHTTSRSQRNRVCGLSGSRGDTLRVARGRDFFTACEAECKQRSDSHSFRRRALVSHGIPMIRCVSVTLNVADVQ